MDLPVIGLVGIKAVLFDLHGSLVHVENNVSEEEISNLLSSRGYEVSPQQLRASWAFVAFVDYPKYGYKSWQSFFSRILRRLNVRVDKETLREVVKLLKRRPYKLYPDAAEAVIKAKQGGMKTAIVTTIAHFQFQKAVKPLREYFDFIMTGFEAGCDKTNPRMYKRVLEILNVEPREAVMIGDNADIDVDLPKRLGIHAIFLDRTGQNAKPSTADAIANSLPEAVETALGM